MSCLALVYQKFLVLLQQLAVEQKEPGNLFRKHLLKRSLTLLWPESRVTTTQHHVLDIVFVVARRLDRRSTLPNELMSCPS